MLGVNWIIISSLIFCFFIGVVDVMVWSLIIGLLRRLIKNGWFVEFFVIIGISFFSYYVINDVFLDGGRYVVAAWVMGIGVGRFFEGSIMEKVRGG